VHVVEGEAGPSYDEIFVGHTAARTFVKRMAWQVGYVATIPPLGRAVVASHRLPRGAIASGILELAVLEGSELFARVRLLPPAPRPLVTAGENPLQSAARPFWVFPNPRKSLTAEYTVGGNWAFVSVGREATPGTNHDERLRGNYGVLYDVTFNIVNPRDRAAQVEIGFQTAAGAARGVVLIEGQIYETRLVRANREQTLTRLRVPAGANRSVHVQIMPQSGSNYPVRLFCRLAGSGD